MWQCHSARSSLVSALIAAGLMVAASSVHAQEAEYSLLMVDTTNAVLAARDDVGGPRGTHRLTLGLGRTEVATGQADGGTERLALAAWSLNYDYWLGDHWATGLQTDGLLESFVVELQDDEVMERAYPVSMVPVILFRPVGAFALLAGIGTEFAGGSRPVELTRLGVQAGVPFGGRSWQMGATVLWDSKWSYNNSWGVMVTVSRVFGAGPGR